MAISYSDMLVHHKDAQQSSGVQGHSVLHATRHILEAQCAFKILMIHEVLQFALRIAFRCVLHRCGSHDIRCWKLYTLSINLEEGERSGCPFHSTPHFLLIQVSCCIVVWQWWNWYLAQWNVPHIKVTSVCVFGYYVKFTRSPTIMHTGECTQQDQEYLLFHG